MRNLSQSQKVSKENIESNIYINVQAPIYRYLSKILIYCLCLLEREWTLKKPDLPIIGNSTHEIFLFANPKTSFQKLYQYKKNTNIGIHTKTKNTDEGSYFLYKFLVESIWVLPGQQGLGVLHNPRKASWVSRFFLERVWELTSCIACMPQYERP